jgi:hypothetical protein
VEHADLRRSRPGFAWRRFRRWIWVSGAGAGGFGKGLAGRWWPRGSRCSGHQPGRDVADEASIGASSICGSPAPVSPADEPATGVAPTAGTGRDRDR